MARTGLSLIRAGRLSLIPDRVKARRELEAILPASQEVR
jgi:hypothetical protein